MDQERFVNQHYKTPFWGRKTFCLVTGASRGIGKQIAIDFAKKVSTDSLFLITARNLNKLLVTEEEIKKQSGVLVSVEELDLNETKVGTFRNMIKKSLTTYNKTPEDFDLYIIIHNAGSLGDASEAVKDMSDMNKLQSYFNLNLFSVSLLNSEFLKVFKSRSKYDVCVVNITSLCAIKPISSLGYYCIGKASREMFFQVLAVENKEYIVLNYSPGPVLTDMTQEIIDLSADESLRKLYNDMKSTDTIVKTHETVDRLIDILAKGNFESGAHIDFYDTP